MSYAMDKTTKRIVWALSIAMVLSLVFGVGMFLPAQHRAQKLAEMGVKYQARQVQQQRHVDPAQR
jgi:hydroxymethylglutaryl-CoA reductase